MWRREPLRAALGHRQGPARAGHNRTRWHGRLREREVPRVSGRPVLLSLDLGTTNCKAAAFDLDGAEIVRVAVGYPTYTPAADAHLQRPAEWLAAAGPAPCVATQALSDDLPA